MARYSIDTGESVDRATARRTEWQGMGEAGGDEDDARGGPQVLRPDQSAFKGRGEGEGEGKEEEERERERERGGRES